MSLSYIYEIFLYTFFILIIVVYYIILYNKTNISPSKKVSFWLLLLCLLISIILYLLLLFSSNKIFKIISLPYNLTLNLVSYKYIIQLLLLPIIIIIYYLNIHISSLNINIYFIIVSLLLYILLILFFVFGYFNELFIICLILFISYYYIFYYSYMFELKKISYNLNNDNFDFLATNCITESFDNLLPVDIDQLTEQIPLLVDDSIIYNNDIPVSWQDDKNINNFVLADFYYPGSMNTYMTGTNELSVPSLECIKIALNTYKCRIITLDIYYENNEFIIKNKNPSNIFILLSDAFKVIYEYGFINPFPLFLVLNIEQIFTTEQYTDLYYLYIKYFKDNLPPIEYGFNGRNLLFNMSTAEITTCLNKIFFITNKYPTRTILDELINSTTTNDNFNLKIYNIDYLQKGIKKDYNKKETINIHKNTISFFYSNQNKKYKGTGQSRSGLFNPNFKDVAEYGIQGTLMYLFVPDNNLSLWNAFFKTNNYNPIVKNKEDRYIKDDNKIIPVTPITDLQNPDEYCIAPGIRILASNISDLPNTSCSSND